MGNGVLGTASKGPTQQAAQGQMAGHPRRPLYSWTQPPTPSLSGLRMESATYETVNVQQQRQELDAFAPHY